VTSAALHGTYATCFSRCLSTFSTFKDPAGLVFAHACKMSLVGITARGARRTGIKSKNPTAPAVKREAEEDWGR
jgi:hypothetical protein